jgi:hypothetical protein
VQFLRKPPSGKSCHIDTLRWWVQFRSDAQILLRAAAYRGAYILATG